MHKLASTPITINCFEIDDWKIQYSKNFVTEYLIPYLEDLRVSYNKTKDVGYWKELIRWLPDGWLQTRTVTMNYENLWGICSKGQRRNHKLTEWRESFITWARTLPYAQELIFIDQKPTYVEIIFPSDNPEEITVSDDFVVSSAATQGT